MVSPATLRFSLAKPSDAAKVAALHADSWRRHYRGAYADEFLDGDVVADRLAVWSHRLCDASATSTILAEDGGTLVGFVHTVFDHDPTWGALVDNLHVDYRHKRNGVGARLMSLAAEEIQGREPSTGLYLWVLEQNTAAQAFYQACGGRRTDPRPVPPPGGVPERLNGAPVCLRYAWPDPAALIGRSTTAADR